ncbi:MAG TPA: UDP-N-acetylmuramoyl-L-alanine--D-glutamate ligase [Cyclobacteriaceae bacterium]|nr:UDP-N-acetylmuramoyl-L-alanine--D-glutamate ligase [Cyclobacteriaceae bacterium]
MKERVTILGAGESGTGAALLAKAKGYDVFVSDLGAIANGYKTELAAADVAFEEGTHTLERVLDCTLIVKSPGIPWNAPAVAAAEKAGIEIIDEIEFAFRYAQSNIIAITGTNGKTTTTLLTYHLLREAGYKVALAGNVGISFARQVASGNYDWYVLEVSSFQLDGITTFNPLVGILLNITPDHLNRYSSMAEYTDSKFRLVRNMGADQYFIYVADDPIIAEEINRRDIRARQIRVSLQGQTEAYYDGQEMNFTVDGSFRIKQSDTTLVGPHNLLNTMAAVSAARLAGVAADDIRKALLTFRNAPHRLEPVGTINGVAFINDSKATNVDSVAYALSSYPGPLIWIAGGIDKGNDYGQIMDEVKNKVKVLICLGKDNEKLRRAFSDVVAIIRETQDMRELVRMALQAAESGDVVLLSPACASFDLFRNYEDRGDQFRAAVKELAEAQGMNKG